MCSTPSCPGRLDLAGFGELGSLLAVIVVASVPGTALQAVIARRLTTGDDEHGYLRDTVLLAACVGGAVAVLSPLLRAFLDVASFAPVLWTAAILVPSTVAFGYLGLLQGAGRFRALAAMLVGGAGRAGHRRDSSLTSPAVGPAPRSPWERW